MGRVMFFIYFSHLNVVDVFCYLPLFPLSLQKRMPLFDYPDVLTLVVIGSV